jgi:hypothetical protein
VTAKAAALAYSLALNHPFIDGNKRVAHVAMEVFLALNGLPTFMPMLTNRKRYSSILPQAVEPPRAGTLAWPSHHCARALISRLMFCREPAARDASNLLSLAANSDTADLPPIADQPP